jgi:hypothetical protein
MNGFFLQFWVVFGLLCSLLVLIAAWLFRISAAPLWLRLVVPTILVILGCYAPISINQMLGYPITVTMAQLPDKVQLVAYAPHDEDKVVDLWLRTETDGIPRSYETVLDEPLKKVLRQAQHEMDQGGLVSLRKATRKAKGNEKPGVVSDGNIPEQYTIDPSALTELPAKDESK